MKKFIAFMLALALLLVSAAAFAEGETVIRTLPQYTYYSATLLTEESYPEVCIGPYYPYAYFNSNPKDTTFLCFPGPEGATASNFSSSSVHYLDPDNQIQYEYYINESDSYEEFINKAAQDEYILLDGEGGMAAYIQPEYDQAYGMIGTKEFAKSAKLIIRISLDALTSSMPEEMHIEALTNAILPEVQRVKEQMHYVSFPSYWSARKYSGSKLLYSNFSDLCCVDFPEMSVVMDGKTVNAKFIVTGVDESKIEGVYSFAPDVYVETEIEFDSYCYPLTKLEEKDENAFTTTLSSGNEWIMYSGNMQDDGRVYRFLAARAIPGLMDRDRQVYVTVTMSGNRIEWADFDDCISDLELFDANIKVVKDADDPYVAPAVVETPAAAPADSSESASSGVDFSAMISAIKNAAGNDEATGEAADADGSWTCPTCGNVNVGKFCPECGTPKPEDPTWTCPTCGNVNEGKFCPECGTPKP